MKNRVWLITFALFFTGCMSPVYEEQYVDVPISWRLDTNEGTTLCNIRWWEQFEDPVLNELIFIALKNNQDLHVAISRVLQYYDQYRIVSASLYPFITGNGSYNRIENTLAVPGVAPPGTPRILNEYLGTVNLSWELDFWGKVRSASAAAQAELLSQVNARRAIVLSVVSSVAEAYIILRQLDGQLIISRETLGTRIESLKLATRRFELGETSELEVWQAKSLVEDAAIRVLTFERQIPLQENLLSVLLGEPSQDIERGLPLESFEYPINIPAGLPSDLLSRRPDILQAEFELVAANARVSEARALFFPQMTLTGMFGNESIHLHNFLSSPAQMWQYGISAVQAIWDTGRIYYTVQDAKDFRNELLFKYRQSILQAFQEVNDALVEVQKNRELVTAHEKQVAVLQQYYRLAQLRYTEGEIDYLNVLDAERQLFAAQLALMEAEGDKYTAVVRLYKALGGGWVIDADEIAIYE